MSETIRLDVRNQHWQVDPPVVAAQLHRLPLDAFVKLVELRRRRSLNPFFDHSVDIHALRNRNRGFALVPAFHLSSSDLYLAVITNSFDSVEGLNPFVDELAAWRLLNGILAVGLQRFDGFDAIFELAGVHQHGMQLLEALRGG